MKRSKQDLKETSKELSKRYREGSGNYMTSDELRSVYVDVRMPATLAACKKALSALPSFAPETMKDLGAGPGTATVAAFETFGSLVSSTLYEQDQNLIGIGKEIVSSEKTTWVLEDIRKEKPFVQSDLTILSYVTNEIEDPESLLKRAWQSTAMVLLIIEPGTPRGFQKILKARELLINEGAHIVAPCPHANDCPMKQGDWCHFSARLERSKLHREIKEGTLGFEDEKFSYAAFSREPHRTLLSRVIRNPEIHGGHRVFTLCTPTGVDRRTVSKKQGDFYKLAKKVDWGDLL